jgi:hypothetical protein
MPARSPSPSRDLATSLSRQSQQPPLPDNQGRCPFFNIIRRHRIKTPIAHTTAHPPPPRIPSNMTPTIDLINNKLTCCPRMWIAIEGVRRHDLLKEATLDVVSRLTWIVRALLPTPKTTRYWKEEGSLRVPILSKFRFNLVIPFFCGGWMRVEVPGGIFGSLSGSLIVVSLCSLFVY